MIIGGQFYGRRFKLVVPHGMQLRLAHQFRVTKSFVSKVLRQKRGGRKADGIVKVAVEKFGGKVEKASLTSKE